jgi:hypothetical protein
VAALRADRPLPRYRSLYAVEKQRRSSPDAARALAGRRRQTGQVGYLNQGWEDEMNSMARKNSAPAPARGLIVVWLLSFPVALVAMGYALGMF